MQIIEVSRSGYAQLIELIELLLQELEEEYEDYRHMDHSAIMNSLEKAGDRFVAFFAADANENPIGFITITESFAVYAGGNYGIIDEMYVKPAFRGAGIGKTLIKRAKKHAKEKGWQRLDVTTPTETRWARTRVFYEREGFSFTGNKLKFKL